MELQSKVTAIKGIGIKKALLLEKLNINKVEDFLFFYPKSYQDRRKAVQIRNLTASKVGLVRGKIVSIEKDRYYPRRKQLLKLVVNDGTGSMEVVFFNAKYLENIFKSGETYDFYGKITLDCGKVQMIHPDYSKAEVQNQGGIIPVYTLTAGISQNEMRKWQNAVSQLVSDSIEYLDEEIIIRNRLCSLSYALLNIHFPKEPQKFREARYRLVFDELLVLQTGLMFLKSGLQKGKKGIAFDKNIDINEYLEKLPYKMTEAQKKVAAEVLEDMEADRAMNRLIHGDVGSGKTLIAEIALYKASKSGFQGVLMAPTELLAKQHYNGIKANFEPFGISVDLLTGSLTTKEKDDCLKKLKSGETDVLIGTHAIIQSVVEFKNLGLIITDEQHRFGVNQRSILASKGKNPDTLVMTATPIPRTLAVILYGDLDISKIDQLPPGRQKIITRAVDGQGRAAAYEFLKRELRAGRQGYVVTPLIEDSEVQNIKSAESVYEELKCKFNEYNIALLHGEMKAKEKDKIMKDFYDENIDLLVSTVVIEVGINVKNATVMLVENAERFGLAQLHQLRGRVGRGKEQSYCILVSDGKSQVAQKRAEIMVSTNDGFIIAEKDLELRGPGEFFGTRQHGIPDLHIANLIKHIDMLEIVKEEAKLILEEDVGLESERNAGIKNRIDKTFKDNMTLKL